MWYHGSNGLTENKTKAAELYTRALENGFTPALHELGKMYIQEEGGLKAPLDATMSEVGTSLLERWSEALNANDTDAWLWELIVSCHASRLDQCAGIERSVREWYSAN